MEQVWCYRKKTGPGKVTAPDQSEETLLPFLETGRMALRTPGSLFPAHLHFLPWGAEITDTC